MRMLITVHFPASKFNKAVRDGSAGAKIEKILGEIKPEAAYFTESNGERTAVLIADVAEPSSVPKIAEPWFLHFKARVEFRVCMTPEDLAAAGLDELGKKYSK